MQFELSETQQLLKSSARKFLQTECPIAEVRRLMETPTANDTALWRQISAQGWTGILFPEEHDGMGLGLVETAAAMEEMGRALLPGPYLSTVLMAGVLVDAAGNEDQKRHWLAPICRGEAKATVAILEEDASWSMREYKTRADGHLLSGRKLFVSDAEEAAFLLILASLDGQPAIVAVDRQAKGLLVEAMPAL
ncbi:MAG: acyl-CoA dehydrogenase family protein, partial [Acidobacteriia bacterium]|nr:acyl-CoA dehydrogenase family protein [Terriglobia bacterium]